MRTVCRMSHVLESLREAIASIPVIDAHEHSCGHDGCQPTTGVTSFVLSHYVSSMLPYVSTEQTPGILDESVPDRERWGRFASLWPNLMGTGYGMLVKHMLRQWEADDADLMGSYDPILAKLKSRSPSYARDAFQHAGVRGVLTHYLTHPCCGGIGNLVDFFSGRLAFEQRFFPLLGTTPLHDFHQPEEVQQVGLIAGNEVTSLGNLVSAVETIIDRSVQRGVIGLKDHTAYSRGLAVQTPDRAAARKELDVLLGGTPLADPQRALSDYLFHRAVGCARDHGLPVAIHTGTLVGGPDPKANVRLLAPVLATYPDVRFDLYHLNYPWFEDFLAVLKLYPNTYANCCWTHIIDPEGTERFLSQAVGTVPANRVFGFGGDFVSSPEAPLAHLAIARDNIAGALSHAVERRRLSHGEAVRVARIWLYEAPMALYGLAGAVGDVAP